MRPPFLSGVPERLVMGISEKSNYVAKLSKELGITYSHAVKIINLLEEQKIVTKTKEGRKIKIELTQKGLDIQEHFKEIRRLL